MFAPGGVVPSLVWTSVPADDPAIVRTFGVRVSALADLPGTADSWMSVAFRSRGPHLVPQAIAGARPHAAGVLNNQGLEHGPS